MRTSAIRKMEESAIEVEIAKLREEYATVVEDVRLGKEKNVSKTLKIKRNIARMLTVLKEMILTK